MAGERRQECHYRAVSGCRRPGPGEERPHPPGAAADWQESWWFDFFAADGSVGGWLELALHPGRRRAWYHAVLIGPGRRPLAIAGSEAPLPRGPDLEVRAPGLWAEHGCRTAFEHWQVANEAFAVAVEDPLELLAADPRGELVPLAFDLEWEADGLAVARGPVGLDGDAYDLPCRVHGEVAVGAERIDLDGFGGRGHGWGSRPAAPAELAWAARLDDGLRFLVLRADEGGPGGWVQPPEGPCEPVTSVADVTTADGPDGLPGPGAVVVGGLALGFEPLAVGAGLLGAPGTLEGHGQVRALCRFLDGAGGEGIGWAAWGRR